VSPPQLQVTESAGDAGGEDLGEGVCLGGSGEAPRRDLLLVDHAVGEGFLAESSGSQEQQRGQGASEERSNAGLDRRGATDPAVLYLGRGLR